MQLRVVALGGRVALQKCDDEGVWSHVSIQRCETIKSGIYTLHNASAPVPSRFYSGSVLAEHEGILYQLVDGSRVVRHAAPAEIKLAVGDKVQLDYSTGMSRPTATLIQKSPVLKRTRIMSKKG